MGGMSCRHMFSARTAKVGIGWMEEIRYFISALLRRTGRFGVPAFDAYAQPAECLNVFMVMSDSSVSVFE